MTCYEIAKKIMRKIRERIDCSSGVYRGIRYYDDPSGGTEYFTLDYEDVRVGVINGRMYKLEITNPRGIILFNLRLWLMQLDRMTK